MLDLRCLTFRISTLRINFFPSDSLLKQKKKKKKQTTNIVWYLAPITKTYLYNFDPFKPHFYIVKLGFTGVYVIFLISAQKHRLWVLEVSRNMKKISEFLSENFQFLVMKFSIYLNRLVFVMERVKGQVNTIKVMSRRSVYLTTLFIGRRTCTHSFAKTDNHLGEISSSNFDLISLWEGRTG